jgi:hypothetical protein
MDKQRDAVVLLRKKPHGVVVIRTGSTYFKGR